MSTERELRKEIKKYLKAPDWEWTSIESGGTVSGVPDNYWSHRATRTSGWLELKVTSGWALEFRPHQIGWLQRHAAAGVRCAVLVRQGGQDRGAAAPRDVLWLLGGEHAAFWALHGLPRPGAAAPPGGVLGRWEQGPRRWDWDALAAVLAL